MKILGIDTATSTAGLAILDDAVVLAEARHDTSGRGADLLVAIDALCRAAGVGPTALDAIAIGAGPGSFTGLRIGMATAKGIAFAAGRPLWAVSSLAALAEDAARELAGRAATQPNATATQPNATATQPNATATQPNATATQPNATATQVHSAAPIVAVLDARRSEVFAGVFVRGAAIAPERVMAPAELAPWVAEAVRAHASTDVSTAWFAGDAIEAYRELLAPLATPRPDEVRWLTARTPSGTAVARLALAGAHVDITRGGAPVYIRPSEAEVMYPDGVPGALRRR